MNMSDTISLPAHVGIILDGNRRWAKANGLPSLEGHRQGAEVFKEITQHAFNRGIKFVSAYVFSTENWQRSEEEVGFLMDLVVKAAEQYMQEFNQRGIKVVILGRRDGLRRKVLRAITQAEEKTQGNTKGTLALCLNYGGQAEISDAANKLMQEGIPISPESITQALYTPELPAVDLLIRTSGEQRLSGFMMWRSAYAELYFSKIMWPAFTTTDFDDALADYQNRSRRFGAS